MVRFAALLSLAGTLAAGPAGAAIVNGGFETGNFSGWTLVTDDLTFATVSSQAPVPQSGIWGASFGSPSTLSQTVATVAGSFYALDFWLQDEADVLGAATPNSFEATWNGTTVTSLVNTAAFNYKHLTFNLAATSASTVVAFTFRNDPGFWDLDNVAVTAVPEPETWALMGLGLALLAARRRRLSTRE
ncbi:MAG: PEP-CTERM sorting domain-containing protein [Pseudomonadota bacterium]|nr:PEP-CTERM sorting domain-containing protein [Pseudomonadota bacterium]